MIENRRELMAGTGEHHDYWRRKLLASLGIVLLDTAAPRE